MWLIGNLLILYFILWFFTRILIKHLKSMMQKTFSKSVEQSLQKYQLGLLWFSYSNDVTFPFLKSLDLLPFWTSVYHFLLDRNEKFSVILPICIENFPWRPSFFKRSLCSSILQFFYHNLELSLYSSMIADGS